MRLRPFTFVIFLLILMDPSRRAFAQGDTSSEVLTEDEERTYVPYSELTPRNVQGAFAQAFDKAAPDVLTRDLASAIEECAYNYFGWMLTKDVRQLNAYFTMTRPDYMARRGPLTAEDSERTYRQHFATWRDDYVSGDAIRALGFALDPVRIAQGDPTDSFYWFPRRSGGSEWSERFRQGIQEGSKRDTYAIADTTFVQVNAIAKNDDGKWRLMTVVWRWDEKPQGLRNAFEWHGAALDPGVDVFTYYYGLNERVAPAVITIPEPLGDRAP